MEQNVLQETNEYVVNNIKYQVLAYFQPSDDKSSTEDFADKIKHLILLEDILSNNRKK